MATKFFSPPIDIYSTATEYKVFASIPDAAKSIIGVQVDPNDREIIISGQLFRPEEFGGLSPEELEKVLIHEERPVGSFERILKIPWIDEVNWHGLRMRFDNGVFVLTLPKGVAQDSGKGLVGVEIGVAKITFV